MAWAPSYASVAELQSWMVRDQTFAVYEATEAAFVLEAASRAVDLWCNRQFGVTTAQPRYYSGDTSVFLDCGRALPVDDISATTSLAVVTDLANDGLFSTTLTLGTDFELWPYNAANESRPWTHLMLTPRATSYFPWTYRGIKVTALFGWATVPDAVKLATLIQASRFMVRRDSAFGVAGSPDLGSELRLQAKLDPDVQVSLMRFRRYWGAA